MKRVVSMFLLCSLMLGTILSSGFMSAGAEDLANTNATFYNNAQVRAADPHVLYDKASGYYYAYSTDGASRGYRFGIYRSADLTTWEALNGAIPSDDPNTWANDWFWAPECYYNENNGYYYLFYSGRMTNTTDVESHFGSFANGIKFEEACKTGVAVSRSPEGPFMNITKAPIDYYPYDPDYYDVNQLMDAAQMLPPATQALGQTAPKGVYLPFIDANVFFDDNGDIYLYYSRNAYRNWVWDTDLGKYIEESNIYAVKLTTDWWNTDGEPVMPKIDPASRDANKPAGDTSGKRMDGFTPIINYGMQKQSWENGHVNDYVDYSGTKKNRRWAEGSTTMKFYYNQNGERKSKYYIVYSCNNFENQFYGEGYATADSPLGPWTKYEGNPIVKMDETGDTKIYSTGHGSFINSPDGSEMFHVYHGRPTISSTRRYMYTNRFIFDEESLDAAGNPTLRVDQVIGDQSIPSGVAPYSINYSLTEHSENRSIYDISFNVKNADGGELPLNNAANRVNVVISDPAKATYTPIDEYSGTIKLLSDEEVQIDFIYQRQKADGSYEDVYNGYNDADNPGTIVALNLIFNSADVSRLEKLIAQIETELAGLNLDEYTEESVSALLAALEAAKELVSNPALAVNDQDAVDDAYLALAVAKGALAVKGETPSPDPSSPPTSAPDTSAPTSQVSSDPEKGPATGIPNTGDFTPLSVLIILFSAALCAVPVLLVKSAKKKPE